MGKDTAQYFNHISCIAVRSAISDFDRPFVTTVGVLTAADVVDWTGAEAVLVGATDVVRVVDVAGFEVAAGLLVVTAVELPLPAVATTDGDAADDETTAEALDDGDTGGGLSTNEDDPGPTADGRAVSVVGPATVDVHELNSTAAIDKPTITPLRRLFTLDTPRRPRDNTGEMTIARALVHR